MIDSPGSISPSVHSSDERPRSRAASHQFRPQSQPSRTGFFHFIFVFIVSRKKEKKIVAMHSDCSLFILYIFCNSGAMKMTKKDKPPENV